MSAKGEAEEWAAFVSRYGERNDLTYEPIGGINPKDGPVALCVGGTNRLTGQLSEGFWGSSCDADEREAGGLFGKAILPRSAAGQGPHARPGQGRPRLQRRVDRGP